MTPPQIMEWGAAHNFPALLLISEKGNIDRLAHGPYAWAFMAESDNVKRIELVCKRIEMWQKLEAPEVK